MFSNLTTKIALKKLGLPCNALDFNLPGWTDGEGPDDRADPKRPLKRSATVSVTNLDTNERYYEHGSDADGKNGGWPGWIAVPSVPVTMQPWLAPAPPPVEIAPECPKAGDLAPVDRDRKLGLGSGRSVLVLFLRCVGCAFAQRSFLALRSLSVKNPTVRCVAVSHSSAAATTKWLELMGGAWGVEVVVDEDRAVYAAWGLGLCSVWHVFNPASQVQGWKETGWLGDKVAGAIGVTRANSSGSESEGRDESDGTSRGATENKREVGKSRMQRSWTGRFTRSNTAPSRTGDGVPKKATTPEHSPAAVMGNKWQTAGAFALDGSGTVVWGGKATRVDDVFDLEAGMAALKR